MPIFTIAYRDMSDFSAEELSFMGVMTMDETEEWLILRRNTKTLSQPFAQWEYTY